MSAPSTLPPSSTDVDRPFGRRRLLAFRASLVFAALLPLLWGSTALASAIGGGPHRLHDLVGSGVLLAALWLAPLAAMWHPRRIPGALLAYQTFLAAAFAAAVVSRSNAVVVIVLLVQGGLVLAAHPDRRRTLAGTFRLHRPLLVAALVPSLPLVAYAVREGGLQATGGAHAHLAHYFDQAWVAIAIVLLAVLAASRPDLRRLAGRSGGLALAAVGLISVLLPHAASSFGTVGGGAAILAGLTIVAGAEVAGRWDAHARSDD